MAMPVTQSVPMINGKNPNNPFNGFHWLEVSNLPHED
jgi:hypothetical protein